jgi:hypothetical protein
MWMLCLSHGIYDEPLIGLQYTSEGEEYPLEAYKEYSDDGGGEQMMVICEDHLQYEADGAFPLYISLPRGSCGSPHGVHL